MVMNELNVHSMSAAKKDSKIQRSIAESLESMKLDKLIEEENLAAERERAEEESMSAVQSMQERRQKERDDAALLVKMENLNFNRILPKAFGMIVYESLPIDPKVKQADSVEIYKFCEEVFNQLQEAEIVNVSSSPIFSEYAGVIQHKVADIREKLTMEEIEGILSDLTMSCAPSIKHLTRNVYDKAVEVISVEKDINNVRTELAESDRYFTNDKTLFRKLNEAAITELTTGSDEISLSRKGIMEMALAETLLKYTLIETLHTSKLIKINPANVKAMAFAL